MDADDYEGLEMCLEFLTLFVQMLHCVCGVTFSVKLIAFIVKG